LKERICVLILYKLILLSLLAVYQLLSLLFDLEVNPFRITSFAIAGLSLFSVFSFALITRLDLKGHSLRNFTFLQFIADLAFTTFMMMYTGGADSYFRFLYLGVILLASTFFEKIIIYAISVISLAFFMFGLAFLLLFSELPITPSNFLEELADPLRFQFVLCFGSSLLASFMQSFFRSARKEILVKNQEVLRLQRIRKQIVETLPSGLLTCEKDGTLSFINDVGRNYLELSDQDTHLNAFALLNLEIPDQQSQQTRVERTIPVKGKTKSFGVSFCPMELDNERRGFLIVFQDLTKIKMLEAQSRLQDRMAAIGKMAAGVAHEIRNPLASISGSTQVIREVVSDDEEMAELADIVVTETKRLDSIISSFLAYARPGPPPNPEPIDLVDYTKHFIQLLRNDPKLKDFQVVYQGLQDVLIMGDSTRLSQIYWNLVRNAYQACDPEEGRITISITRENDKVVLQISDNGIGMSETQVQDVFTPFQSFRENGTGLGMAVVYENVRVHDGSVSVKSELGEGTTVRIEFPELL
jgi:two-component system sensor histidine kinase PilS (NtrC family)